MKIYFHKKITFFFEADKKLLNLIKRSHFLFYLYKTFFHFSPNSDFFLRIIDFVIIKKVSLSSLNRHAVATRDDVGISKAMCLQNHFSSIFPECEVDARVQLYDSSSEEEILSGHPDYILDCIDNIDTKVYS